MFIKQQLHKNKKQPKALLKKYINVLLTLSFTCLTTIQMIARDFEIIKDHLI